MVSAPNTNDFVGVGSHCGDVCIDHIDMLRLHTNKINPVLWIDLKHSFCRCIVRF